MVLRPWKITKRWRELLLTRIEEVVSQTLLDSHLEFERLEFLGDSILNAFITKRLFEEHPQETEGQLSAKKSFLVSNAFLREWTLGPIGIRHVLGKEVAPKTTLFSDKVVGSIFEGYVGYMCQCRGRVWMRRFLHKYFWPIACRRLQEGQWQSYRNLVQMLFQKRFQALPEFKVTEVSISADEEHRFRAQLVMGSEVVAVGFGKSKKKAIENASRMYWRNENEDLPGTEEQY